MDEQTRRQFLESTAAGGLAALAGCQGESDDKPEGASIDLTLVNTYSSSDYSSAEEMARDLSDDFEIDGDTYHILGTSQIDGVHDESERTAALSLYEDDNFEEPFGRFSLGIDETTETDQGFSIEVNDIEYSLPDEAQEQIEDIDEDDLGLPEDADEEKKESRLETLETEIYQSEASATARILIQELEEN